MNISHVIFHPIIPQNYSKSVEIFIIWNVLLVNVAFSDCSAVTQDQGSRDSKIYPSIKLTGPQRSLNPSILIIIFATNCGSCLCLVMQKK